MEDVISRQKKRLKDILKDVKGRQNSINSEASQRAFHFPKNGGDQLWSFCVTGDRTSAIITHS